jgi:predicted PurR-regulated permease PerM
MKRAAYRAVPRSRRETVAYLADDILERIGGYVAGALGIALIAGTTTCLLLVALGVPSPVALALVVMVTDLVPVIGATLGAIVVSSVAFAHDIQAGIVVALFYLVYQQFENYVLYPRIMKRSVDVSPAVTIVAVLLGGSLMGILGALLAIPTAAAVQLVMLEVVLPHQEAS